MIFYYFIFITLNPQNKMAMYACMLVYVCGILHERLPLYQYNSVLSLHIPSRARGIHEIQQIITTTPHIRLNSEFIDEF